MNSIKLSVWDRLGIAAFWLTWPGLWLVLRWSKRTRAVVRAEGKILVVRGWLSNGKWSLPGGGVHRGEDARQALIREVEEETGLRLKPLQLNRVGGFRFSSEGLSFAYTLFSADIKNSLETRRQRLEISAIAWVSEQDLDAKNANDDVLTALNVDT